jgi:hypothetical protein
MTNNVVRAAAEGMPDVNRRRLLLGLASASAVAATVSIPQADATPMENPDLIRLGNELPAVEARYLNAVAAVRAIAAEWSPVWPVVPAELVGFSTRNNVENNIFGLPVRGADGKFRTFKGAPELNEWKNMMERDLGRKQIKCEKRRAHIRASIANHERQIAVAEKYEAECDRIVQASGIRAATRREVNAVKALANHVDAIMTLPETSMTGVMVKAQALALWGKMPSHDQNIALFQALNWGPMFGASVVRLSEGGAA